MSGMDRIRTMLNSHLFTPNLRRLTTALSSQLYYVFSTDSRCFLWGLLPWKIVTGNRKLLGNGWEMVVGCLWETCVCRRHDCDHSTIVTRVTRRDLTFSWRLNFELIQEFKTRARAHSDLWFVYEGSRKIPKIPLTTKNQRVGIYMHHGLSRRGLFLNVHSISLKTNIIR